MADWRFGDVLRPSAAAAGYENIRLLYIGEAKPEDKMPTDRRLIYGTYLIDAAASASNWVGRVSTFYGDAYELVDD